MASCVRGVLAWRGTGRDPGSDGPRGRAKRAKRPRGWHLVVSAKPEGFSAAVPDRKTRRPTRPLQKATRALSEDAIGQLKLSRGGLSRWCNTASKQFLMYTVHTPSRVSNGARLSESELKIEAGLALPQNARRSPPGPASGLPSNARAAATAAIAGTPRAPPPQQTSHPARPLADERYLVVRKAALEDAHDLPAVRQGLLPPAEEGVRLVRLPGRQDAPV